MTSQYSKSGCVRRVGEFSDPSITAYERLEIRNGMKEVEVNLRVGLRRFADQKWQDGKWNERTSLVAVANFVSYNSRRKVLG
jgi:hypothetical protein